MVLITGCIHINSPMQERTFFVLKKILTKVERFLVSTYVVCERLSVMQRQARLPEIFDQIAQFTPDLEFGSRTPTPPPPISKL